MKFTKEQAVEKLNQALTNGGKKPLRMSSRTLEGQVETLLSFITDEEMELDDFVEKVKGGLSSVNSNMEHDQSDFIKNYEKEHPAPKTNPAPKEEPDPNDPNAALLKRLEELERRDREREDAVLIENKRAEIKKYLHDNNVKDEKWISSIFGISSIGKDDDAEERGKAFLDIYNQSLSKNSPLVPLSPKGGDESSAGAFDEVKAMRKHRAEVQK